MLEESFHPVEEGDGWKEQPLTWKMVIIVNFVVVIVMSRK
jgi:hypothetical protein